MAARLVPGRARLVLGRNSTQDLPATARRSRVDPAAIAGDISDIKGSPGCRHSRSGVAWEMVAGGKRWPGKPPELRTLYKRVVRASCPRLSVARGRSRKWVKNGAFFAMLTEPWAGDRLVLEGGSAGFRVLAPDQCRTACTARELRSCLAGPAVCRVLRLEFPGVRRPDRDPQDRDTLSAARAGSRPAGCGDREGTVRTPGPAAEVAGFFVGYSPPRRSLETRRTRLHVEFTHDSHL